MAVNIPTHPVKSESMIYGKNPWFWWGTSDRDGDAGDWLAAPVGSIYIYNNAGTAAVIYFKEALDGDDADWQDLTLTE